eukprot:4998575-Pyramimonas_sp.AAC.2
MASMNKMGHLREIVQALCDPDLMQLTLMADNPGACLPAHRGASRLELANAMVTLAREVLAKELAYCSMFVWWLPLRLAGVL